MVKKPKKLWEQYVGKAQAEGLRGSGCWPAQPHFCELEPPCDAYDRKRVNPWCCYVNDWEASYYGGKAVLRRKQPLEVPPVDPPSMDSLVTIRVEQYPDDDSTMALTDQLLHASLTLHRPVAFELVGSVKGTHTQFTCDPDDHPLLDRQIAIQFPNSAVVLEATCPLLDNDGLLQETKKSIGAMLSLRQPYCFPLRTYRYLNPDPVSVAIAAMEQLEKDDWAVLQVLWQPARQTWQQTLIDSIANPYKRNDYFLAIETDQVRAIHEKFTSPLFAVSVRLLASTADVFRHLVGWSEQFANPPLQAMEVNTESWAEGMLDDTERSWLDYAVTHRCTFRPGMIMNAEELACLVHLPTTGIASERLKKVATRTRPAKDEFGSIILGENVHRGKVKQATIPASLRPRHVYVCGSTGTGKSTLLLNMICQDIDAGHGVGVLDPHGDLIKAVLPRIPADRIDDVILFDPTDRDYPFAMNILSAQDEEERERIVDETIMALQRYFPASWGPRLERILTFAIKGVLSADPASTLADVERILVDDEFRLSLADRMSSERYRRFWTVEFKKHGPSAIDPVLNKLSVFVEKRIVRNIVCQRHCAVDFDDVLNNRKIFLANLSTGVLNESVANILGSFLVTKIINAAFRRASIPEDHRVPWYCFIDEFQNFMGVSVGFERILSESRKYKLCLAGLANQYIGQLSPTVRQAIFGNIGVMITFRLGVEDANTAAREMGVFTAEEIMNLELGEAIARAGGSQTAYNLITHPEPALPEVDVSGTIKERMHSRFAKARAEVEREFGNHCRKVETIGKGESEGAKNQVDPMDPNEDDFVS